MEVKSVRVFVELVSTYWLHLNRFSFKHIMYLFHRQCHSQTKQKWNIDSARNFSPNKIYIILQNVIVLSGMLSTPVVWASLYHFFLPRVRFVPSHVTREPLEQIVIQPVAAITTRLVTPRLARVSVQQGTSAKSRSLWTAFFIHIHVYSTWKVIIQQFIKNLSWKKMILHLPFQKLFVFVI